MKAFLTLEVYTYKKSIEDLMIRYHFIQAKIDLNRRTSGLNSANFVIAVV